MCSSFQFCIEFLLTFMASNRTMIINECHARHVTEDQSQRPSYRTKFGRNSIELFELDFSDERNRNKKVLSERYACAGGRCLAINVKLTKMSNVQCGEIQLNGIGGRFVIACFRSESRVAPIMPNSVTRVTLADAKNSRMRASKR